MTARVSVSLLLAFLAAGAPPLSAHHSAAMFDQQKTLELTGTVRLFQWNNPHCYIQLLVPDAQGRQTEWSLEMGAPMYLYNRGWRPSTLKPGDRITVKYSPLRKGGTAGLLLEARGADGRELGRTATKP